VPPEAAKPPVPVPWSKWRHGHEELARLEEAA
jgi:hypothetical protein